MLGFQANGENRHDMRQIFATAAQDSCGCIEREHLLLASAFHQQQSNFSDTD